MPSRKNVAERNNFFSKKQKKRKQHNPAQIIPQKHSQNATTTQRSKTLIEQSKQQVAVQANSAVTILFWQVGNRINQEILQNKRAEYGKQIVPTLQLKSQQTLG